MKREERIAKDERTQKQDYITRLDEIKSWLKTQRGYKVIDFGLSTIPYLVTEFKTGFSFKGGERISTPTYTAKGCFDLIMLATEPDGTFEYSLIQYHAGRYLSSIFKNLPFTVFFCTPTKAFKWSPRGEMNLIISEGNLVVDMESEGIKEIKFK